MKKTIRYYSTVKILTCIAILVGISMSYFIIVSDNDLDFRINWNMFKSVLIIPLCIVGFILGLGQKFQVYESFIETRDATTGRLLKVERNDDITDSMMAGCLFPLLNYFVITPLVIAAMIYYPLMAIVYLFAVVFPFIITGFILFSLVFLYKFLNRLVDSRLRHIFIPFVSVLFIGIYWLCYYLWVNNGAESPYGNMPLLIVIVGAGLCILLFSILVITVNEDDEEVYAETDLTHSSDISGGFLLTFIITFILIIGVYSFKLLSSSSATSDYYADSTFSFYTVNSKTSLNVRSGPGGSYEKVGSLNSGDQIGVYSIEGDWAAIDYHGSKGYVHSQYLTAPITESDVSSSDQEQTEILSEDTNCSDLVEEQVDNPSNIHLNISQTTGVITSHNVAYDKFYKNRRISQSEREYLKIDFINRSLPNNELVKGKVIYMGNNGRLETFLNVVEDQNTSEVLVSYNSNGDYVSHIKIGELGVYSGDRAYARIEGNGLSVYIYTIEDESVSEETVRYIITPELNFRKL